MKNIVNFILETKDDNLLMFNNQLKFSSWFKGLANKQFKGMTSSKLGKKPNYAIYFDDVDCVDPNNDSTIEGVKCNNKLTWGEAGAKLIEYFEKTYDLKEKDAWTEADVELVKKAFKEKFNVSMNEKTKNIELVAKENKDKFIFFKRKYTVRVSWRSEGAMQPVKILGENSSLSEMIEYFKKYSEKRY